MREDWFHKYFAHDVILLFMILQWERKTWYSTNSHVFCWLGNGSVIRDLHIIIKLTSNNETIRRTPQLPSTTRQWRSYELERDHQMRPFYFLPWSSHANATSNLPPRDRDALLDWSPTTPLPFSFRFRSQQKEGHMASRSRTHPPLPCGPAAH